MIPGDIKFLSEPVSKVKPNLGVSSVVGCKSLVRISSNRKLRIREREADDAC